MTSPGDELRRFVERVILARPGDELGLVLGGEGKLWVMAARDVDWSDPRAPQVDAKHVQGFEGARLWTLMAASNADDIDITCYPLDDGSWSLVFDWKVGSKPVHEIPDVGLRPMPKGVTMYVRD